MSEFRGDSLKELAKGALKEFHHSSPESQALFRRQYVQAFMIGLFSEVVPKEDGVIDQSLFELRLRIRDRVRIEVLGTHQTALEHLRVSQAILVEEYEAATIEEDRFAPELALAKDTQTWGLHLDIVDDQFAMEVFEKAKLVVS